MVFIPLNVDPRHPQSRSGSSQHDARVAPENRQ